MAVEIGTAFVDIVPSARGISTKLGQELSGPLTRAGKDAGDKTAHAFGGRFKLGLAGAGAIAAGVLGGAAVIGGARALAHSLRDVVNEARDAARIGRLTGAVLHSTGGVANISAEQVGNLATKLSNLSGIDDDLIQSSENVLLTFTGIRNEVGKGNDIFNQASAAAVDLSAALGQDLQSSSIQLGKALNDPIKGVGALSRVGVSFTAQQKDQIKTLVESGNVLGAQKVILNELGKEFGGAAEAAADPLARLSVIAGNFKEQLGGALLPVIGQVANSLGSLLPTLATALTPLISTLAPAVVGVFSALLPAILPLVTTLARTVAPLLSQLAGAFADTFEAIGPIISALAPPLAAIAGQFVGVLRALIPLGPPIGLLVAAVAPLVAGFSQLAVTIAQAVLPLVAPLVGLLTEIATAFIGTAKAPGPLLQILGVLGDVFKQLGSALLPVIVQIARQIGPIFTEAGGALSGAFGAALKAIIPAVGSLLGALVPILPIIAQLAADLLTGLAPVLPELAKAFADLVVAVTPLLPPLLELAVLLIDKIGIPTIVALATALAALATAMTPLLTNTKILTPLVFGLAGAFAAVKGVQALQAGILGLAKAGGTTVGTFQRLQGKAGKFFDATRSGAGAVSRVAKGILDLGKSALVSAANVAKNVAAFVAQKVAMLAAAVAQKAMAAAQWLLNAAMTANPVGLLVAGIAALAAGVILAYQHFKPFRDIVDAVGRVFRSVFNFIAKNWPLVLTILTGPFGLAVLAIKAHWSKITGFAKGAFNWVKDHWPLLLAILTGPIGLAVLAITRNWDKIKAGFRAVKDFIGSRVGEIVGFITGIPGRIAQTVSTLWNGLIRGVRTAKEFIGNRINDVVGFVTGLPSRISGAASGMWDGIKEAFRSAINFIIRGWNGLDFSLPSVKVFGKKIGGFTLGTPDIPELAQGGVVTQPTFALIGERAPEIVTPVALLKKLLADAGTGKAEQFVVNINAPVFGVDHLHAEIERASIAAFRKRTRQNGSVSGVRVTY